MGENLATPEAVRRRIAEAPERETITLGDWKVRNFPTRAALATALLTGCRAKEIVSIVAPDEQREGIIYGVHGCKKVEDIVEEYEGNEYLIINVTVLKKRLMLASSRVVAVPRNPEYEPLAPTVEDAFTQAGNAPVFHHTRQTLSIAARQTFSGLSYYIHPYLHFPPKTEGEEKKPGHEVRGHPRPMAIHALRHIREQELEGYYHLEDRQIQTFFKWSNTYMGVPETMGQYRAIRDWHMYAQKLLKKTPQNAENNPVL